MGLFFSFWCYHCIHLIYQQSEQQSPWTLLPTKVWGLQVISIPIHHHLLLSGHESHLWSCINTQKGRENYSHFPHTWRRAQSSLKSGMACSKCLHILISFRITLIPPPVRGCLMLYASPRGRTPARERLPKSIITEQEQHLGIHYKLSQDVGKRDSMPNPCQVISNCLRSIFTMQLADHFTHLIFIYHFL